MDKYQKEYFNGEYSLGFLVNMLDSKESTKYISVDSENDVLKIKQDEDITKTKYQITIKKELFVKSISIYKNGEWEECSNGIAILDFESRAEKIKLSMQDNIVDDYELRIVYVEADKNKYYEKQRINQRKMLINNISVKVSTGVNLVNIYFQPCNNDYDKTEITLLKEQQMLAKYKVEKDCFYYAINNLASGTYYFILKQYDSQGNLIVETDKTKFYIQSQDYDGDLYF